MQHGNKWGTFMGNRSSTLDGQTRKNNSFHSFKIVHTIQWCIAIIEVIEGIFKYQLVILNRKRVLKNHSMVPNDSIREV